MTIDKRWGGSNLLPVTVISLIFSIVLIGLSSPEIDTYSGVTLFGAVITFVHTIVDIALYFTSKLKPLYALILSCFLLTFWFNNLILGSIEQAYLNCSDYGYYDRYGDYISSQQSRCSMPKARFAFTIFVFFLYIAAVVLSALTYQRDQKVRFEKNGNELIAKYFSTDPPAVDSSGYGAEFAANQQGVPTPATSPGIYGPPKRMYNQPSGIYNQPSGIYNQPSGTYNQPSGTYNQPSGTYYNPNHITGQDKIVSGAAEEDNAPS